MLLIRLMYVSVYYIYTICTYVYAMLTYICNVLVINTELYWLTVMGKWAKLLAMCVLIPFATYAKYEIQIQIHTYIYSYSNTDNYSYICLPVCRPAGAIRNFCLLLTLLTFFALRLRLLPISRIRHICPARLPHGPHGVYTLNCTTSRPAAPPSSISVRV